ncbi:MAG: CehA/McbA family metallohydrolase [Verrucomicrobia bacterium]|nr:CehA/McbA family metallohydrolase [Verrucomicrobiota bacterium]
MKWIALPSPARNPVAAARTRTLAGWLSATAALGWCTGIQGHEPTGHHSPTYEVTAPVAIGADQKRLSLQVVDAATGRPTAARFSLEVDDRDFVPDGLGTGGLRFVSIHNGKKQKFAACYSRGTGPVDVPLPPGAGRVVVYAVKGLEYRPEEISLDVTGRVTDATVNLRRWTDVRARGWIAVEEHAHYDRLDPAHDADWLTILAGDDLSQAHFMVAKGYNLPGFWAAQYAYGSRGEASNGERLIRPGEEYRDNLQGHINLLGAREIVGPTLTGAGEHPHNWPPFFDVLSRAQELGGIVGPAHGAELGLSSTGVADTILGRSDFFEIANTHLYKIEIWYRLLNCGFIVPPVAGTDLPNYPSRLPWQPLLGEIRTYAKTGGSVAFDAFKEAIARGETFVSSGPMIALAVERAGPGGTVRLPAGGGEVVVEAELSGPRDLQTLEIVRQGEAIAMEVVKSRDGTTHRWRIKGRWRFDRSAWVAARGTGELKQALLKEANIRQHTLAHTAPIRVLVGDEPIASPSDASFLAARLTDKIALYRSAGKYRQPEDRDRALGIFEAAIQKLQPR